MPCLCITNNLRLFIQSLAQVDVALSKSVPLYQRQLRKPTPRSFTTFHATRQAQAAFDLSQPTSTSHLSSDDSRHRDDGTDHAVKRRPQNPSADSLGNIDKQDAIAVLSPESIDALSAELRSQTLSDETFVEANRSWSIPQRKKLEPDTVIKPTFRRTKTQNTSFALHYSSPPAFRPTSDRTPRSESEWGRDLQPPSTVKQDRLPVEQERAPKKDDWEPPPREQWQIDKAALKEKFPEGWKPQKRLSPDALAGIRALHAQMPNVYTTSALAQNFEVSPEAIRRILKSKWSPDSEEETDRQRRWFNRGKMVYSIHAEKGQKPPKRWRELGIGNGRPEWLLRKRARPPPPALVTTSRRRDMESIKGYTGETERSERDAEYTSLVDRII